MLCWFFRLRISEAMDGDGVLSRAAEKHIRHCANCREFHSRCVSLADGLRSEAAVSNDKTSRRLSTRILRAIQIPASGAAESRRQVTAGGGCVHSINCACGGFVSGKAPQ